MRIINFHGIGEPLRPLEAGEAPYWIDADVYRDWLDRIARHPQRALFQITFDDGNISDLTIGVRELVQRGLTGTFFVLTGRLGKPGSLDRAAVNQLLAMGMKIGSHGVDHVDWSALPEAHLERELRDSRSALEDLAEREITSAAIPFGRYNARVLKALRRNGYRNVFSSDGGESSDNAYPKPRTSVRSGMSTADITRILSGTVPSATRLRRWVGMTAKQYF